MNPIAATLKNNRTLGSKGLNNCSEESACVQKSRVQLKLWLILQKENKKSWRISLLRKSQSLKLFLWIGLYLYFTLLTESCGGLPPVNTDYYFYISSY
jgi:hypothetical protein